MQSVTLCADIVTKVGISEIKIQKPSKAPVFQAKSKDRLLNIVYNKGTYYLFKPGVQEKQTHVSMIEDNLWLIAAHMPNQMVEVRQNDIVRFGRMTFQMTQVRMGPDSQTRDEAGPGIINRGYDMHYES